MSKAYKELQAEAKKIGVNPVGKTAKDLADIIKKHRGAEKAKVEEAEKAQEKAVKSDEKAEKGADTVVVLNGKAEVRRYTKEIHGKEFKKLAKRFCKGTVYELKLVKAKGKIQCPACGHMFESK